MLVILAACSKEEDLKLVSLKGPTSMGLVYTKAAKTMDLVSAPDEILGKVTGKEADLAMVPINMAANLYQKMDGQVRLLAVNTVGNLYLLGKEPLNDFEDLEGKTIVSAGQGATPMYILNYLTKGINVKVDYLPTHSDVIASASENRGDYYLLPEPFVSLYLNKIEGGQLAYNLAEAYKEKTGHLLTMGCLITTEDKLKEKGNEIEKFLKEYESSVDKVLNDPKAAAGLIKSYGILEDESLAEKALPSSGIVYLKPQESKEDVEAFLQLLMEENPKAIGGALPEDDFYEAN